MNTYHYYPGNLPIVVSIPHAGTYIPETIANRLTQQALELPDTDWHVDHLYAFVRELGVHLLVATHSRYVIDLNRDASGESLYPGQFTTGLCPITLFNGSPIYHSHETLNENEIQERVKTYWQPYHDKLQTIISELKSQSRVIVFDAHSIKSQVPILFNGVLPDLNIGTYDGQAASKQLENKIVEYFNNTHYETVCNARFKGGYITRHYGSPENGIDAVQLELAQHNYMNETSPYDYDSQKANSLQQVLRGIFSIMMEYLNNT